MFDDLRAAALAAEATATEAEAAAHEARAAATAARRELIEAEIAELVTQGWSRPDPARPLVMLERGDCYAQAWWVAAAAPSYRGPGVPEYYAWTCGRGTQTSHHPPYACATLAEAAGHARRMLEAADAR